MEDNKNIEKQNKTYSTWNTKRKIKKLGDFKLSKEEKFLIKATDKEIRQLVINELKTNLEKYEKEIIDINQKLKNDKDNSNSSTKKHKKYIIQKIRKVKKCLNDEGGIKARVKLLKHRRHKLMVKKRKVDKSLGDLKTLLKRCLKCKKRGHIAENCPLNKEEKEENNNDNNQHYADSKICYNCGSKEHTLYQCDKHVDYQNLPYAECFKCKGKGHISANCPKNENGIYIRGGSCFICKGKDHLAKNCPQKQLKEEAFENKKEKKV